LLPVQTVASLFPAQLSDLIGFEFRLGPQDGPVDFMFRVARPAARLCDALVCRLATDPAWSRLSDFFRTWAAPDSMLHQQIGNIWLEFDLDPPAAGPPEPNVFFETEVGFARTTSATSLVNEVLVLLGETTLNHAARQCLRSCLQQVPTGATNVVFGVLLPRQVDFLRVCLLGLNAEQTLCCLSKIGWTGNLSEVRPTLDTLAPTVDCLALNLDVAETVRPQVGVEYTLALRTQPGTYPDWNPALTTLQHLGMCRPGLRDALLRFGGWNGRGWNASGVGIDAAKSGVQSRRTEIWQRLNHLKVVHAPEAAPEAKCYLFAQELKVGQTGVSTTAG
jgi:hypothetical protein